MTDHICTICNKALEINAEITVISDAILWETHPVPSDTPDRYTLCQSCVQDLDKFLSTLADIRRDPFYSRLAIRAFTTNLKTFPERRIDHEN